jgi:hypothetical protein
VLRHGKIRPRRGMAAVSQFADFRAEDWTLHNDKITARF